MSDHRMMQLLERVRNLTAERDAYKKILKAIGDLQSDDGEHLFTPDWDKIRRLEWWIGGDND